MAHGRYSQYQANCSSCNALTTKKYAREHGGQCKTCVTGVDQSRGLKCPTCGEYTLTAYQQAHKYHCDACTRNADPQGYYNEVMGYND